MKRRELAVIAATVLAAVCATAQAGSLAVGKRIKINVDAKAAEKARADLWQKFGGWCAIKDWHPAIANCEESKDGDTVFRTLTLKDGGKIKEKLLESKPNFYKYTIIESPLPVKDYTAQFSLTPAQDEDDIMIFAWSAVFDPEGKPDTESRAVIDGIFKAGLDSIQAKIGGDAKTDKDDGKDGDKDKDKN